MTPSTCFPLVGLPATGSVRYSMADSSVAVAFFEVVVDFCNFQVASRGFGWSMEDIATPVSSCRCSAKTGDNDTINAVPPFSWCVVHTVGGFLQTSPNVRWETGLWWQLADDITDVVA